MNLKIVFKILIRILFISTVALLLTGVVAKIYHESLLPFVFSAATSISLAALFYAISGRKNINQLGKREAFLTVTSAWILMSIIGALPYIFSGYFNSIVDAIFESVSGFTTTGSSILVNIEALPKSILFWRSMTHWIGGIGIIVLVIVIMPSLKIGGYNLFTLESSLQDKIQPRIKSVGFRLLLIYISLTLAEVFFLMLGGMNLFESVCHSFGTVATGGFSPKNTSITDYSPYIQYVITVFMILAGTNFVVHYFLIKRNFKKIKTNEELKYYLGVILVSGIIITLILFFKTTRSFETSFREAFFQVSSIITCTGFATADYLLWPKMAWLLIFALMFVGGSTGSTAGGIKIARHVIAFKNIKNTLHSLLHPRVVKLVKLNSRKLGDDQNKNVLTFILLYLLVFVVGTFILIFSGIDGSTAAGSIATAMGGIGPGIGSVGPAANFAHLSDFAKITISLFMILGRLEIYTVLILMFPMFWKKT